ncbi:MAG TPA: type II toxin-antitoxin system HicA family toxin [Candidatus Nanoarchaeia archaeon]|nr:type II toxin-antitoxin system HicA family toxin [Candidatus Nanoarchaeia archaeon]
MGKLPILSGKEIISALKRAGFEEKRQTGSHVHLVGIHQQRREKTLVTVPLHGNKEVLPKTLLSILRQAGLTRGEFEKLLS